MHSLLDATSVCLINGARGIEGPMRVRVVLRGAVQGVGFRPFVFRLARELGLAGWVSNSAQGVLIEAEGDAQRLREFLVRIEPERPPHSFIQGFEATWLDVAGCTGFEIRASSDAGRRTALVLPDIATCPECQQEIFDPADRRFGYPFTNCTHCGPRFSIIGSLPYDRPNTSMKGFAMCDRCREEYENPSDRRFHAQPNACPDCGPHLELWDPAGRPIQTQREALQEAARALRQGAIVAVKGLGGFHLMVLASDDAAVRRLRTRKHREEKPFALMLPTLAKVGAVCQVEALEGRLLSSAESPIVLLRHRSGPPSDLSPAIAPGNPHLGVMLPATPLHHLLLALVGQAVVATSGNLSDEPICIDEQEAVLRLGGIADTFLVHNRPIVRHVDDSVVRVVLGREMVLRRARGYAPWPIHVRESLPPTLAVGAHLKNTVAVGRDHEIFLSQHIGDLETAPALAAFERVTADFLRLFDVTPEIVAADAHPDYLSTQHARKISQRVVCVQHHYAHVLSCMAENDAAAPLLGVSWDGTGLGTDESIWGGEFLLLTEDSFMRAGHLRAFRLPGGDKAVQEPRRAALGMLFAMHGERAFALKQLPTLQAFKPAELRTLRQMLSGQVNSPVTTSAGRLFDAVASLTGLRQETRFEGQAAMDLEFALEQDDSDEAYPLPLVAPGNTAADREPIRVCPVHPECRALNPAAPNFIVDWAPMLEAIAVDLERGVPVWQISAKFHNALAECVVAAGHRLGQRRVVLTGGCFQNRYLLERTVQRLHSEGFSAYWHQRVPPNDGGIAVGQVMAAARMAKQRQR